MEVRAGEPFRAGIAQCTGFPEPPTTALEIHVGRRWPSLLPIPVGGSFWLTLRVPHRYPVTKLTASLGPSWPAWTRIDPPEAFLTGGEGSEAQQLMQAWILGPLTTPGTYMLTITVEDAEGCRAQVRDPRPVRVQ